MQLACNKAQQGTLTPAQYNLSINTGQNMWLDYLRGEYQKYQPGRPVSVVEFSQNEMIRTSLSPLIYGALLTPNPITGIAPYPSDFEFTDAMWGQYGFYKIKFVQQGRLASNYNSVIDPIQSNPIYLIKHEGFQFYPETIGTTSLSYVRTPPGIVWAYTEDANGRPIYDPLNSVSPVWANTDMMQVIVRALQFIGLNLDLPLVLQYANEIKNTGQ
jgi:hypothetical protein